MTQNQDGLDPSYLRDDYLRTKLEIASSFMVAMLSNPQIYTWEPLEQDQSQEQKSLEESIIVIAHDLAVELMSCCQPTEHEKDKQTRFLHGWKSHGMPEGLESWLYRAYGDVVEDASDYKWPFAT